MPRVRPVLTRSAPRPAAGCRLLSVSAAALLWATPALAQESGLRGAVAETEITGSLLPRAPDQAAVEQNQPFPPYVPMSPGAVAEEPHAI